MEKTSKSPIYLPEDQDIIDRLIENTAKSSSGNIIARDMANSNLVALQIEASLRSRKTMVDVDKSNRKFSIVLGIFAMVQVFIVALQFVLDFGNSTNKLWGGFLAIVLIIFMFWITRSMDQVFKSFN